MSPIDAHTWTYGDISRHMPRVSMYCDVWHRMSMEDSAVYMLFTVVVNGHNYCVAFCRYTAMCVRRASMYGPIRSMNNGSNARSNMPLI